MYISQKGCNMVDIEDYKEVKDCIYKDEHFSARDNGAVMRHPKEGTRVRKDDNVWTFGKPNDKTGYMEFTGQRVHRIVAFAFLGNPPSNLHVVDHIDTNRRNNRPENLRWITRLENVLLNEITRKKIEYLCGSVEAFLENPSLLNGYEADDSNFGWMRAVSKEESENTLKRWKSLQERPRKPSSGNTMGEWMFTKPQEQKDDGFKVVYRDDNPQNSLASYNACGMIEEEKKPIFNSNPNNELITDPCDNQVLQYRQQNERKKEKNIINSEIISLVGDLANKNGWNFQSNVKNDRWKADILLSDRMNKVALKLLRRTNKIEEEIGIMKEDGVTCYWLVDKLGFLLNKEGSLNPVFTFSKVDYDFKVDLSYIYKCSMEDFISAAMNRKLNVDEEVIVKSIKVRFIQKNCWKCGTKNFIYIVSKLICDEGEIQNMNNDLDEHVDEFEPNVLNSVQSYLIKHPELNYNFGEIKARYSHTLKESYMSFGCPQCDALFGDNYFTDSRMDDLYSPEDEFVHAIKLGEPGIKVKYLHWRIV